MRIIPAMDIIDSEVVRLTQGDYNRKTIYSKDPIETARKFIETGVSKLHLVDLSGAKKSAPVHHKLFGQIRALGAAVEAGGGIRSLRDVEMLFDAGLDPSTDRIMIGSLPFKEPAEFRKILKERHNNILLTVDVWGEEVKISGWQEGTGKDLFEFMREMIDLGVNHYLITQIKRDGMMSGPDTDLYVKIDDKFSDIFVTVSGGVSSMEDITSFPRLKTIDGIILGRAFYENKVTLEDLKNLHG